MSIKGGLGELICVTWLCPCIERNLRQGLGLAVGYDKDREVWECKWLSSRDLFIPNGTSHIPTLPRYPLPGAWPGGDDGRGA